LNHEETGGYLDTCLSDALGSVRDLACDKRIALRYEKFRSMGRFEDRARHAH